MVLVLVVGSITLFSAFFLGSFSSWFGFLFPKTKGLHWGKFAGIFAGKPLDSTQIPLKLDPDVDQFEGDRKEAISKAEVSKSEFRNV